MKPKLLFVSDMVQAEQYQLTLELCFTMMEFASYFIGNCNLSVEQYVSSTKAQLSFPFMKDILGYPRPHEVRLIRRTFIFLSQVAKLGKVVAKLILSSNLTKPG